MAKHQSLTELAARFAANVAALEKSQSGQFDPVACKDSVEWSEKLQAAMDDLFALRNDLLDPAEAIFQTVLGVRT